MEYNDSRIFYTHMKKSDALNLIFLIPTALLLLIVAARRPPLFYGDILREYPVQDEERTVSLDPVGVNGQTGNAYIGEVSGRMIIKLRLDTAKENITQTSFIYKGTCSSLDGVRYYIAPAFEGKSTSTYYGMNIEAIKKDLPLSIVVNKSLEEHWEIVSCGTIEI